MTLVEAKYALLAACMMHVEGYYSTKSMAFKNFNPGNIRSKAGPFIQYPSPQAGFVALVDDIAANKGNTLRKFIAKYAPPNENNTSQYAAIVSQLSGIGLDEVL